MKRIDTAPWSFPSPTVCQLGDHLLQVSRDNGKLVLLEILPGEKIAYENLFTEFKCGEYLACCALGPLLLVVSGDGGSTAAFLVGLEGDVLSSKTTRIARLQTQGHIDWKPTPFLCELSRNQALLGLDLDNCLWICSVTKLTLTLTAASEVAPFGGGFRARPIRFPNGKLLVAGGYLETTDITLISFDGKLSFERAGSIPVSARFGVSAVLLKDRFVIGFGGSERGDMWIFDLATRNSSQILRRGDWAYGDDLVSLAVYNDTLYLLGGAKYNIISSLRLSILADLICDAKIKTEFCSALGIAAPVVVELEPQYKGIPGVNVSKFPVMGFWSCNTIYHQNRVFHFSLNNGELLITEVVLGEAVGHTVVSTGLRFAAGESRLCGCCTLGDDILVMWGRYTARGIKPGQNASQHKPDVFAALVRVDADEELTEKTVHATKLDVFGGTEWPDLPFLVQIGDNRVWLSFFRSSRVWFCEVGKTSLRMTKTAHTLPTAGGFGAVPVAHASGQLLVAGAVPLSRSIYMVSADDGLSVETIGSMPGEPRSCTTCIPLTKRFAVGFGGSNRGSEKDLWIFDFHTGNSTVVEDAAKWHPGAFWPILVFQDDTLYIIGGYKSTYITAISVDTLCSKVKDAKIRSALQTELRAEKYASSRNTSSWQGLQSVAIPDMRLTTGMFQFHTRRDSDAEEYELLSDDFLDHLFGLDV